MSAQFVQLDKLLCEVLPTNPFYARKLGAAGVSADLAGLDDFFARVPFTTKAELIADQSANPPYGSDLTYPFYNYTRCHQTSGSAGRPLRWLDTPQSWNWMLDQWELVHRAAGTAHSDTLFFAFSFGPFLGFWTAFEAAQRFSALCVPGGGMQSVARLRAILDQAVTVLCCTPSYAIHLAEVAARENISLRYSKVRLLCVAGEPGGSIPATRRRLEELWPGARVFDHHGMTEVGPVTFECPARPGVLHVIESAYIAEVVDPATGRRAEPGQTGELVLTNLGRTGSPLLRYRTGDLVKPLPLRGHCACGRHDLALEGGILGRVDDMVVIRGVNVFPTAVEEIIRGAGGVAEYRVRVNRSRALAELSVEIEPDAGCLDTPALVRRLEHAFESAFTLRVPVREVAPGALPRYEMKAKRWVTE
ncbi:MAG: AMP-binding protein [Verrucomicrobia bacterium]|nr:AMP-binding protein [Verrucomicrobiota bacterium]